MTEPDEKGRVALTRGGTGVIEDIGTLPGLERGPWSSRYLQGLIDVPYLNLTPSTRSGVIHDERYAAFAKALVPLEAHLNGLIDAQRRAEEEQANRESLRAIQRAFREAMLVLPPEEYDWFDIQSRSSQAVAGGELPEPRGEAVGEEGPGPGIPEPSGSESVQRQFFDYAGPFPTLFTFPPPPTPPLYHTPPYHALPRNPLTL